MPTTTATTATAATAEAKPSASVPRANEYLFHPEDLRIAPEMNGRHVNTPVDDLIQSFLSVGQLQAVLIRRDGDGPPVLAAGFRRWRAAMEINNQRLVPGGFRLRCYYLKADEAGAVVANIHENICRAGTQVLDDAYNIARLERYGRSASEITAIYGKALAEKDAKKWVGEQTRLTQLSQESQEALTGGKLKITAARAIAKLAAAKQHERLMEVEARSANAALPKPPKPPKTKVQPFPQDDVVAALEQIRHECREKFTDVESRCWGLADEALVKIAEWQAGRG